MPVPDPVPSHVNMRRVWRFFRVLAALSVAIATLGVVLVTSGAGEVHASLIIATALGIGLTVLLGTGLMTLMFLSASSGHDADAARRAEEEEEEP